MHVRFPKGIAIRKTEVTHKEQAMKIGTWFPFLRKGYAGGWYPSPILSITTAIIGISIYFGCVCTFEFPFLGVLLGLVLEVVWNGLCLWAIEALAERFGVEVEDQ